MTQVAHNLLNLTQALEERWRQYLSGGEVDAFVEFTLVLNNLTERLAQRHMPGLAHTCQELENTALALFGSTATNLAAPADRVVDMERQLLAIIEQVRRYETPAAGGRRNPDADPVLDNGWGRPRQILIVAPEGHPWSAALCAQLEFFGFRPQRVDWEQEVAPEESPQAVVFIPERRLPAYPPERVEVIRRLRAQFAVSYFYCLSVPSSLETIVPLQRAGADACVPAGNRSNDILARILDQLQMREDEEPRVLIVDDSPTAIAHIRRTLSRHGIDSRAINDPRHLLETAADYQPDILLTDIHMPFCTGIEATRALRQLPEYQSLPILYLSSEPDIAQQVAALRLGGDQFLAKPVNSLLLAAVVKTQIERRRGMEHAARHDSLTGLLNHSAAKGRLDEMARQAGDGPLTVAMIDIDHFKSVNDTYGHPVGDQVIRSLAWLLRGRLRSSDLIGRYGGEEFIIALPGAAPAHARELLDRIREDFALLPHAHSQGSLHVTFSGGIAILPDYRTCDSLVQMADEALLLAKRNGRNRFEVAPAFVATQ